MPLVGYQPIHYDLTPINVWIRSGVDSYKVSTTVLHTTFATSVNFAIFAS